MEDLRAFNRSVVRHGERTAVRSPDGREYDYSELDRRTDALANAFDDRISDGRTASLLLNGPAAIEMMITAQKRGRANAQLSYRGSVGEVQHMVTVANARALVFDEANADLAYEVMDQTEIDTGIYVGDRLPDDSGVERYEDVISSNDRDYPTSLDGSAESAVLYTSGTTSKPKAVLQDQQRAWRASSQVVMEHGLRPTDVALVTTPWYHDVTTVAWILPHLQVGATLVTQPRFVPDETLSLLERYEITGLLAVPAQLNALLNLYQEQHDLSNLNYVRTGGALVSPTLVNRIRERMTEGVHNTYGLTEGFANLAHAYPEQQIEHPGTVGHASFNWELRVVEAVEASDTPDPDATVDRGESGELLGYGPATDGYLDNPEAEERLFVDGWLRTMDIARIDEDGGLHIVDRVDNMIVSGGENIYPQEVELVLEDHPDVDAAAVVGVADEEWGERVAAVVVAEDVSEADIEKHCRDHTDLANFKRPREYVITTDSLPRTDTGTIRRDAVIDRYYS